MNPHFLYLSWNKEQPDEHLQYKNDKFDEVEVLTSVGPYKNNYGNMVLEKNSVYYWQIKIIQGNYFKVGVMKKSLIGELKPGAFSDHKKGYSYFSTGKLRNGSNSAGNDFAQGGYGPGDIIKVEFNSKKGKLLFGKNDQPLVEGFQDDDFKNGGYVPAIATLIEGSRYSLTLPDLED